MDVSVTLKFVWDRPVQSKVTTLEYWQIYGLVLMLLTIKLCRYPKVINETTEDFSGAYLVGLYIASELFYLPVRTYP